VFSGKVLVQGGGGSARGGKTDQELDDGEQAGGDRDVGKVGAGTGTKKRKARLMWHQPSRSFTPDDGMTVVGSNAQLRGVSGDMVSVDAVLIPECNSGCPAWLG
jgi:hypothetical protein